MKRFLILGLIAWAFCVGGQAQGLVHFITLTKASGWIVAPVFDTDGQTYVAPGTVYGQLYAGAEPGSLTPVGSPVLCGPRPGYFDGGVVTISTIAPGAAAYVELRAWDSASPSFESAVNGSFRWGQSRMFYLPFTGAGDPPSPAVELVGLYSFSLVPEPSTFTLALIGFGAWGLLRRCR